jgi:hypothetical protein
VRVLGRLATRGRRPPLQQPRACSSPIVVPALAEACTCLTIFHELRWIQAAALFDNPLYSGSMIGCRLFGAIEDYLGCTSRISLIHVRTRSLVLL